MIRELLLTTAALSAFEAHAQDAHPAPMSDSEIVVTGTRTEGRAALESSAPVDVLGGGEVLESGYPDLGRALNVLEPGVNFARAATTATRVPCSSYPPLLE